VRSQNRRPLLLKPVRSLIPWRAVKALGEGPGPIPGYPVRKVIESPKGRTGTSITFNQRYLLKTGAATQFVRAKSLGICSDQSKSRIPRPTPGRD